MANLPQTSSRAGDRFAPGALEGGLARAPEILGVTLWVVGVILLVNAFKSDEGFLPRTVIWLLRALFGMGAFLLPAALIILGIIFITRWDGVAPRVLFRSFAICFISYLTGYHLGIPRGLEFDRMLSEGRGGMVGGLLSALMRRAMGDTASYLVIGGAMVIGLLLLSDEPIVDTIRELAAGAVAQVGAFGSGMLRTLALIHWPRRQPRALRQIVVTKQPTGSPATESARSMEAPSALTFSTSLRAGPNPVPGGRGDSAPETVAALEKPSAARTSSRPFGQPRRRKAMQPGLFPRGGGNLPEQYAAMVQALDPPLPTDTKSVAADDEAGIALVEGTLASFRIEAKVTNIKRGPVITRYEVQPAPGIRINRITNLADDLALALAAIDVRVEAPVPGKSVIGIEVPNKRVALVRLRELIEMEEFASARSKLTFVLGKDIAGQPKIADLAKMPHLLISGATNSGKSVCLNTLITSILCRADPSEVRLSLIDPKRVELTPYKDIPHLFHPVVVDARDAVRALRGSIREMDLRYRLFSAKGVRNIQTYNERLDEGETPLGYIVIIIDELADLMMQAAAEFERLICRLAQMARATGIHLILATQRPSVNVLTGVIKANISSRIAFAVASQVDSRTILDMNGAERLIGSGDMLFHPIDAPKPVRIQGAYISEDEVSRVVDILRAMKGGPKYPLDLESIDDRDELETRRGKDGEHDELFEEAVALVRRRGVASASMLQREFEIGYPRAGRMVDQLEAAGIIGPQDGSKPREVLSPQFDPDDEDAHALAGADTDSPWAR